MKSSSLCKTCELCLGEPRTTAIKATRIWHQQRQSCGRQRRASEKNKIPRQRSLGRYYPPQHANSPGAERNALLKGVLKSTSTRARTFDVIIENRKQHHSGLFFLRSSLWSSFSFRVWFGLWLGIWIGRGI